MARTPRTDAAAWRRAQHARVCDVVEPWEHGTAVRATQLPGFWNYNALRVEGPDGGLSARALAAAADALQGDLAHRQVEVEDEAAGARLRPGFEALGWAAERLLWMVRHGPGPPGPDFEEVPFAATRELRQRWFRTADWATSEAAVRSLAELEDEVARARGSRALVAREDGAPYAFAAFEARAGAAEVEQAYVIPGRRGRGVGGALVAAAVRAAGAPRTFIVADDEAPAKRLYARLGFEPAWVQHVFTRRPG